MLKINRELGRDENKLIGNWVRVKDRIIADDTCERIRYLTESYLEKIGFSEYGTWETLFRDPKDGRYWERTYPHGDWHGGGPPALVNLPEETARQKYHSLFQK